MIIKDKDERTRFQKWCTNVLKQGPSPKHVGFILDGNRRYARNLNLQPLDGHRKGFEKLSETLRWCSDFDITEVTVFIFSIENFKRSAEEVTGLMAMMKEKFENLMDEEENIMREGLCIQVVGDWTLVPPELRPLMAKAMIMTRFNTRAKLNMAFAYTSRNEITRGMKLVQRGLLDGDILEDDVNCNLLEDSFYMMPSRPLDMLVRTSGETRLSDFLLWQSALTVLCFSKVLWPEFSYWHFLSAVFQYQMDTMNLQHLNLKQKELPSTDLEIEKRRSQFIEKIREERWKFFADEAKRCTYVADPTKATVIVSESRHKFRSF